MAAGRNVKLWSSSEITALTMPVCLHLARRRMEEQSSDRRHRPRPAFVFPSHTLNPGRLHGQCTIWEMCPWPELFPSLLWVFLDPSTITSSVCSAKSAAPLPSLLFCKGYPVSKPSTAWFRFVGKLHRWKVSVLWENCIFVVLFWCCVALCVGFRASRRSPFRLSRRISACQKWFETPSLCVLQCFEF